MTEEPSTTPVQMADTLHIDLSHIDPEDVCILIYKHLILITMDYWDFFKEDLVIPEVTVLFADLCMELVQTLSQTILDVVMPQVYRYRTTGGTVSPADFLNEDQIHAYLGDSIQQALVKSLHLPVDSLEHIKAFTELLVSHISRTVNSILAAATQASILESRVPVFFVSGCQTLLPDLKDMINHIVAALRTGFLQQKTEVHSNQTESCGSSDLSTLKSLVFCCSTKDSLRRFMKTYITRMVKLLKTIAQMRYENSEMSSSDRRDICVIVGSNTEILTVEESEVHEQPATSSYSGLDVIPGAVPDNKPSSETSPFSTVTVIDTEHFQRSVDDEAESIENIVDELVQTILGEDQKGPAETGSQESVSSEQEAAYSLKLKELTGRLFNLVMSGQAYQIPCLPDKIRLCDTMTYRKPRRWRVTNPDVIVQALYMRTEELVSRCAVQALMWPTTDWLGSDYIPDPTTDSEIVDSVPSSSNISNSTHDIISNTSEPARSKLLTDIMHKILLNLLVGEILTSIDIVDNNKILELTNKMIVQDVDPKLHDHFLASFMGKTYKDIGQTAINDLLLEFGSVEEMQEAVRAEDPNFEEALKRTLMKQLRFPTTKKTTCSFFKKFKRLCSKKKSKKGSKTQTVRSPTCDEDNGKLQEGPRCLPKSHMFSSLRKTFFYVVRRLGRPFMVCCSPESQVSIITDVDLQAKNLRAKSIGPELKANVKLKEPSHVLIL
ncbi:hypothetical protein PAMP_013878 [Pampus punctatissimus]